MYFVRGVGNSKRGRKYFLLERGNISSWKEEIFPPPVTLYWGRLYFVTSAPKLDANITCMNC